MDELAYLIIEAGINDTYYNSASLANLYPRDHRFVGHMAHHIENKFGRMIEEGLFVQVPPAQNRNYQLSEKGRAAYEKEKAIRKEKADYEFLQKSVSESVLKTNASVSETNESVKATNASIQEINRISAENFSTQNNIAKSSVKVAAVAAMIAIIALILPFVSGGNGDVIKQLQETNRLLKEDRRTLDSILRHQTVIDSILASRPVPAPSNNAKP
ncbi:hypothetical protein Q4E93_09935 [Flavitalea sp. BT771]|uniref:hypothetical protein n=1 Tax=Flavitalea sp. BT771 TaxID=3063329 RepID=UPI0026E22153|nr:hypothetical protein [Flavitalea sp. BT771]MDO6430907.1 hypothetical protein [Flavitalea sp. BT771]MDV6218953.1 hypothetical protein [Flavitalea sp. BT771]